MLRLNCSRSEAVRQRPRRYIRVRVIPIRAEFGSASPATAHRTGSCERWVPENPVVADLYVGSVRRWWLPEAREIERLGQHPLEEA